MLAHAETRACTLCAGTCSTQWAPPHNWRSILARDCAVFQTDPSLHKQECQSRVYRSVSSLLCDQTIGALGDLSHQCFYKCAAYVQAWGSVTASRAGKQLSLTQEITPIQGLFLRASDDQLHTLQLQGSGDCPLLSLVTFSSLGPGHTILFSECGLWLLA